MKRLLLVPVCLLLFGSPTQKLRADGSDKVTICHIPPGNPANAHEITVDSSAVPAHLAHGDNVGVCGVH